MKRKNLGGLALTFFFSFFALAAYAGSLTLEEEKKEEQKVETRTVVINVTGMT